MCDFYIKSSNLLDYKVFNLLENYEKKIIKK